MKTHLRQTCLLLASAWLSLWLLPAARAQDSEWIPLAKGNYWVFKGPVKYLVPDPAQGDPNTANKVVEQTMTWRMEVKEVIRINKVFTVAAIKGWPGDLAWYEPGRERSDLVIVRFGAGKYYELFNEDAAKMLKLARKGQASATRKLLADHGAFIEPPLTENKRYSGEPTDLKRGMYCWIVDSVAAFSAAELKGVPHPEKQRQVYTVSERTNPDRVTFHAVPGIGLVGYEYVHHGTVSEVDVRLVDVHLEKP